MLVYNGRSASLPCVDLRPGITRAKLLVDQINRAWLASIIKPEQKRRNLERESVFESHALASDGWIEKKGVEIRPCIHRWNSFWCRFTCDLVCSQDLTTADKVKLHFEFEASKTGGIFFETDPNFKRIGARSSRRGRHRWHTVRKEKSNVHGYAFIELIRNGQIAKQACLVVATFPSCAW